jgi:hypothetical protein
MVPDKNVGVSYMVTAWARLATLIEVADVQMGGRAFACNGMHRLA